MLQGEFLLLVRDMLLRAEVQLWHRSLHDSLTRRVLRGEFGAASRQALIVKRARELALQWIIG